MEYLWVSLGIAGLFLSFVVAGSIYVYYTEDDDDFKVKPQLFWNYERVTRHRNHSRYSRHSSHSTPPKHSTPPTRTKHTKAATRRLESLTQSIRRENPDLSGKEALLEAIAETPSRNATLILSAKKNKGTPFSNQARTLLEARAKTR